jgi:hypothetical protein
VSNDFIYRMMPLIDRAAEAARGHAEKVINNGHLLWQVYIHEKSKLVDDAANVKNGKPLKSGESMTEEEFEAYLLSRGVWVEPKDK